LAKYDKGAEVMIPDADSRRSKAKISRSHAYSAAMNEQHELSRRHVMFDLENLCALVSSLPSITSPISSIDKHERGFNKALTVTMANGKAVVVKIPFPAMVLAR
jgi:hypothetical protein